MCNTCVLQWVWIVLQCCNVLQCVAVCCSVLQYIPVYSSGVELFVQSQWRSFWSFVSYLWLCFAAWCSGFELCCNVLQSVAECCRVLQCVAVCCSVLQCVAECCRVLQYGWTICTVMMADWFEPVYNTHTCGCVAVCCNNFQLCCSALKWVELFVPALRSDVFFWLVYNICSRVLACAWV